MKRITILLASFVSLSLGATIFATAATVEATRTLQRGSVVHASDLIVTANSPRRGQAEALEDVIGKEVRSTVREGRAIRFSDLRAPILVERNQIVDIVYRSGTLVIRGEGRALRHGGSGERIRVMNLDSRIVVTGRVTPSGQVEVRR